MQDVAQASGVSQATVSLVLNNVAGVRVAETTRLRVHAAAEELGYRRNPRSRADDRNGGVIGMIIDDIAASPFAVPLLEGAREAAWAHGCVVLVTTTRNDRAMEQATLEALTRQPLIGLIYATLFTRIVEPPRTSVPTVLLNCYDAERRYSSVVPDDVAGAKALTNTLIRAGHRRIAHLAGEDLLDASANRITGYQAALSEHGIVADSDLIQRFGSGVAGGREAAHAALDLPVPPTALFCFNDRMALGALEAARERGLRVSEQLSIVGFDNDPFAASLFRGGLTTALLPHQDMAQWAVETILKEKDPKAKRVQKLMACPIVRGHSVAHGRADLSQGAARANRPLQAVSD
jgi:LacI family transcriptional regulator